VRDSEVIAGPAVLLPAIPGLHEGAATSLRLARLLLGADVVIEYRATARAGAPGYGKLMEAPSGLCCSRLHSHFRG
jgi:hypothetical protein